MEGSEHTGCERSDDYKAFRVDLIRISQRADHVIQTSEDNIRRAGICCEQTVQGIRSRREEINEVFDNIENNLIIQAETIKADDIQAMESFAENAKSVLQNVDKIQSKMKGLESSKEFRQLDISMKQFSSEVPCMTTSFDEAENAHIRLYDFEPTSNVEELYTAAEAFGNIRYRHNYRASCKRVLEDHRATSATYISDIALRSDMSSFHWLTGSAVFPGNRLVVIDYCNTMISLIDTQLNSLITDLKLDDRPWDVCAISGNQAAITLTGDHTIMFLKVTDVLRVQRRKIVNGKCCGVAFSREKLYVTFVDPPKMEIMDLEGNVIRTIDNDINGRNLFKWPQYICLSNDQEMIYISDSSLNKIMRLNMNGEIKSEFTFRKWSTPCKVCIDQRGNIYVACHASRTVHMLKADCSEVKVLMTEVDGLSNDVQSVSHLHDTDSLVVGVYGSNTMKVFQLG